MKLLLEDQRDFDPVAHQRAMVELDVRLRRGVPEYVALLETGSTVVGDPWVPGRSDVDVAIVCSRRVDSTDHVQDLLRALSPVAPYSFTIHDRATWLIAAGTTHDFTWRFSTRTLFGQDLPARKALPTRAASSRIVQRGLESIEWRLQTALLNWHLWSAASVRRSSWIALKKLFCVLAVGTWVRTGAFPRSRHTIAAGQGDVRIAVAAGAIASIDRITLEQLRGVVDNTRDLVRELSRTGDG